MIKHKSPCIGICSTTFGDLVCRGCKRFSHEITGWNGYTEDQKRMVWQRLNRIRDESVRVYLRVTHPDQLRATAYTIVDVSDQSLEYLALEVLRRTSIDPIDAGLQATITHSAKPRDELLNAIEQEFYLRSSAFYEHSFRALVR